MGRAYVTSRDDFAVVLEQAIAATRRMLCGGDFLPLRSIAMQLDAMAKWTAGGRTPTDEERSAIQLGVVVFRELEPAQTRELYDYNQRLYELNGFFKEWA